MDEALVTFSYTTKTTFTLISIMFCISEVALVEIDQLLNFIGAILGGGIIGAIISAIVTMRFGERWVETFRIRREHSIKLNEGFLKPWLSKIKEYSKIDAAYSKDSDKMVGVEPEYPTDLNFFDEAKSHLETKYPNVLEAWEELKRVTSQHNEKLAIVLEELRTSIIGELKMHCYYYNLGAEEPAEHIKPDKIARQVYQEIESRAQYERKWFRGEPRVTPVIIGSLKFFRLEWGNNILIRSRDEEKVISSIPFINQLIETPKFNKEEKNLTKRKDEIYKVKRDDFEAKIKEVIESIDLGNILEGKCRHCRKI